MGINEGSLIKYGSQPLIKQPEIKLRDGQRKLYDLIVTTIKNHSTLKREDALGIYKGYVGRCYDSHWISYDEDEEEKAREKYDDWKRYFKEERLMNLTIEKYKTYNGGYRWSVSCRVAWSEWHLNNNFTNWFLRTLGVFVKKGYVTIIP